jgi:hypothetical protein
MVRRGVIAVIVAGCTACGGENNEGDPAADPSEESDPVRCLEARTERLTNFATGAEYSDGASIRSFTYAYPNHVVGEFLDVFHVTGIIDDYAGIGVSFGACVDASKFSGLTFDVWGEAGPTRTLTVYANTRENSPEPPFTETGTCEPADPGDPYRSCLNAYARISVPANRESVRIRFSSFMGGVPHAGVDSGELLAFFLALDWSDSQAPYPIDLTFGDVLFEE